MLILICTGHLYILKAEMGQAGLSRGSGWKTMESPVPKVKFMLKSPHPRGCVLNHFFNKKNRAI